MLTKMSQNHSGTSFFKQVTISTALTSLSGNDAVSFLLLLKHKNTELSKNVSNYLGICKASGAHFNDNRVFSSRVFLSVVPVAESTLNPLYAHLIREQHVAIFIGHPVNSCSFQTCTREVDTELWLKMEVV